MNSSHSRHGIAGSLFPFLPDAHPSDQVAVAVRHLESAICAHLSDSETEKLLESFNDFNETYDSRDFAIRLSNVLNTPVKMQIVPLIRAVIPSSEVDRFDQAMHLCSPHRKSQIDYSEGKNRRSSDWFHTAPARTRPSREPTEASPIIKIHLQPRGGCLGFSISTTRDSHPEVFITRVDPVSPAEECGLQHGDIILEANDIDFSRVSQQDAEKVLHAARSLHLTVKRIRRSTLVAQSDNLSDGRYGDRSRLTENELRGLKWTDVFGRPVSPPSTYLNAVGNVFSNRDGTRKVSLNLKRRGGLGISIRGGAEHGIGIFVSEVNPQSAGELAGIQVGDWIIEINGRSLEGITHAEAVRMLRKHHHLVMTLLYVGKLPHAEPGIVAGPRQPPTADQLFYPGSLGRRSKLLHAQSGAFKRSSSLSNLHTSVSRSIRNLSLLEARGQTLLNQHENLSMREYIEQYLHGELTVDALVARLSTLFNTYAKLPMFSEVKSALMPQDIRRYEWLLKQKRVDSLKSKRDGDLEGGYTSDASTTSSSRSDATGDPLSTLKSTPRFAGQFENARTDGERAVGSSPIPSAEAFRKRAKETSRRRPLLQNVIDALGDTTATEDEREMPHVKERHFPTTASSSHSSDRNTRGSDTKRDQGYRNVNASVDRTTADMAASVPDRGWKRVPTFPSRAEDREHTHASTSVPASGQSPAYRPAGRRVVVYKSSKKLGLAIEGGADTRERLPRVAAVQDSGCAHDSGLRCGDVILQVDDVPTDGLAHDAVARLIARAFRSTGKSYIDFLIMSA